MALFRSLAQLAEELAAETGRLKKRAAIAEAIAAVHAAAPESDDAGLFALYLAGTPFAEADARKLNAGGALLSKALLAVSGASQTELTAAYKRHGDLGAAGFDLLQAREQGSRDREQGLTLEEIATTFAAMATARTTAIRSGLVEGLLRRASPLEAKYLLKLMSGDMRIGVKQSLVEEAIAVATSSPVAEVRNAVMLEADLATATMRAFAGTLGQARMRLFHPLGFMLASPVDSPEEAIERFTGKPASLKKVNSTGRNKSKIQGSLHSGTDNDTVHSSGRDDVSVNPRIEAFLEDKYDGMRAQIHCGDSGQPGRVAIYSRNREDVTESYPELAEAFAAVEQPLIFDGEILGWDLKAARALPFAVLGQRIGRKRVSNEWRQQVPVIFMAFDLMYADGTLLLEQPLRVRRNRLESVAEMLVEKVRSPLTIDERSKGAQSILFTAPDGDSVERLLLAPSRLVESAEDIERAYADARARSNEGVMLKAAASIYQPGRRGLSWVKLKRELATLDVVVTGAEFGHGKRAGILSDYTFAVRGPGSELLNVGKAYSGLTDAEIAEMSAWMMEHTLEDHGFFRTVEPLKVLEVAFNNIMRSGRHSSGFALRFPRIVRIRTDKPVSEIDTVERVEEIYQSQVDKPAEENP
ncbi:MAG TPA: ATP-dependent DNA ligase [Edaphobacter sp.]|nr:ATP-dependent DNA ligase [Edaphobacter sp.]